jgi:hypothetical protein
MSNAIKNGSLDFGDLKSGGSGFSPSPGFQSESEKALQSSPRSPVGRTDKRTKEFTQDKINKPKQTSPKLEAIKQAQKPIDQKLIQPKAAE